MKANKLKTLNNQIIEGPLLITPNLFTDERGYFYELCNISILEEIVGERLILYRIIFLVHEEA